MIHGPGLARWMATITCSYGAFHALETMSPRQRAVLVRERACGTIRTEQREPHGLARALADSPRACIVVEVRLGVARAGGIDLDPGRLQFDRHGERHGIQSRLGRSVAGSEDRAVGIGRVRVPGQ